MKRWCTEARLVTFRDGFAHMKPLYVSNNGRLINVEAPLVSVDSPFIHHEAPYVQDSDAFLCHKWAVVSGNTKYLVEGFMIV